MARTKKDAVAEEAPKTPDRPTKRHRAKSSAVPPQPAAPVDLPPPIVEPRQEPKGLEVTWENFAVIQKHFGLNEPETVRVLTSLIGPNPKARALEPARPVKKEPAPVPETKPCDPKKEEEEPKVTDVPAKRRRLKQIPVVDNQLGDPTLYPELHPECFETDEGTGETQLDGDGEEGEEEDHEHDDEVDEIGVDAKSNNNDDQDSPQGGAAAASSALEEETLPYEPTEAVEPTIAPVAKPDDPAALAKAQLEAMLKATPTPTKQGRRVVEAERIDSGEKPRVKSLRYHVMFQNFLKIKNTPCKMCRPGV